ncbi:MAG: phosphatidylserine decarboxylase [Elusimicrobiota bacterium]
MRIAKEGWSFIGIGLAAAACGVVFARVFGLAEGYVLAAPAALFAGFCGYFFRDPDRPRPVDDSKIYSPGDGRVLSVAREGDGDAWTIRIFLSIFDVHIQRFPCSGTVSKVRYHEGAFAMAMKDEASRNERNVVSIAVEGRGEEVGVEQIAGLIARRIRCWTWEGERAVAGQRYGLIQFGSQAAVHLPGGARPLVKPGDRAVGGVTPVGEWTGASGPAGK